LFEILSFDFCEHFTKIIIEKSACTCVAKLGKTLVYVP